VSCLLSSCFVPHLVIHEDPDQYLTTCFIIAQMDLLFARLAYYPSIPDTIELAEEINLKNIDEKSVLSLNGSTFFFIIISLIFFLSSN